ncbi:MAG: hydrogenase expression/formation C-terminal domain-containing protein [bacterium]
MNNPLESIPVTIDVATGNVVPVLHEIAHALKTLLDSGEPSVIDLRSMPMSTNEESQVLEALGSGEIVATLNALGHSEIIETRFAGVWLITHYNSEQEIMARMIEICECPEILSAPQQDIQAGYHALQQQLSPSDPSESQQS